MGATHRDLPPGSQKWADEMDALREEVKVLKALCARMAQDLRIDPRDPSKNMNPQSDSPTVASPVQQKLSALGDTDTYNVKDGQVLGWSQQKQAWTATDPSARESFPLPMPPAWQNDTQAYGRFVSPSEPYAVYAFGTKGALGQAQVAASTTVVLNAQGQNPGESTYLNVAYQTLPTSDKSGYFEVYCDDTRSGGGHYLLLNANTWQIGQVNIDGTSKFGGQVNGSVVGDANYVEFVADAVRVPASGARPNVSGMAGGRDVGAHMLDTSLNKPIWWTGSGWVDANGTAV